MIRINKSAFDGKWVNYAEEISFFMVPFDSLRIHNKYGKIDMADIIIDSIKDWKGIVDENDKPLEVNEDNIKLVMEFYPETVKFLSEKAFEIHEAVVSEVKN